MKKLFVSLLLLSFAAVCNAADVGGKWIAEVKAPNGSKAERIFDFQASGDKLTGTITNLQVYRAIFQEQGKPALTGTLKTQAADPQPIVDGKITGSDICFAVVDQMFGMEMRTEYKGKVSGDEIKFSVENVSAGGFGGPPMPAQEIVARRAGR